jgi:hypothetical protein
MPLYQVYVKGTKEPFGLEHPADSLEKLSQQLVKNGFVIGPCWKGQTKQPNLHAFFAATIDRIEGGPSQSEPAKPKRPRNIAADSASRYDPHTGKVPRR